MNNEHIAEALSDIEGVIGGKLPVKYKRFLSEEVGENDIYEIKKIQGESIYIYNYHDVLERNKTYMIQDVEPNVFLIGQDGDIGYFIRLGAHDDEIFSLDLGALGSLEMDEEAKDIYSLHG